MKELLKHLRRSFPEDRCKVKTDDDVYQDPVSYFAVRKHPAFPDNFHILLLHPYINIFEGKTYYGWINDEGIYVGNWKNPAAVHYNDRIIGFFDTSAIQVYIGLENLFDEPFPHKICNLKDSTNKLLNIFYSDNPYWIFTIQKGVAGEGFLICKAIPYHYIDETGYHSEWHTDNENYTYDESEDEYVIGCKRIEDEK